MAVPKVGFEPTRSHPQSLLRRSCLPFHHFGHASSIGKGPLDSQDTQALVSGAHSQR